MHNAWPAFAFYIASRPGARGRKLPTSDLSAVKTRGQTAHKKGGPRRSACLSNAAWITGLESPVQAAQRGRILAAHCRRGRLNTMFSAVIPVCCACSKLLFQAGKRCKQDQDENWGDRPATMRRDGKSSA